MASLSQDRSRTRYSLGAIAFHWSIAALIAGNYALAWIAEDLPREQAMQMMANHKALGVTVLLLSVGRIVWRIVNRPPAFLSSLQPGVATLARLTHGLFYLLMIGVPLAGWLIHSAYTGGAPLNAFGIFDYPGLPVAKDKAGVELAAEVHEILANIMLVLIGLHVLGALKHHWLDRDGSLSRMLPWVR